MQAGQVLDRLLRKICPDMHKLRRTALFVNVMAGLHGAVLTVTHLGRAISSDAKEKHCIKRADRLLSNRRLQRERLDVYSALTRQLNRKQATPGAPGRLVRYGRMQTSFPIAGLGPGGGSGADRVRRGAYRTKEKPKTHQRFLQTLQKMLPPDCRPIVVSDAGFRTPWFKEVEALGWDWVGRIRNRHQVQLCGEAAWIPCKRLYDKATSTPRALGQARLTQNNPITCRLVLYKGKPKGRVHLNRFGQASRSSHNRKHAQSQREPWLLGTSLPEGFKHAEKVVKLYALRMKIEEAFRDVKSTRFGLSLELHRTYQVERLQNLLLIATLALMVAWLMGKATELTGQHRHYQANTVRNRVVLSTIFVGLKVIDDPRLTLRLADLLAALRCLDQLIQNHCLSE